MSDQIAVDAQDVIRHLTQQVADQALTIAMLRARLEAAPAPADD